MSINKIEKKFDDSYSPTDWHAISITFMTPSNLKTIELGIEFTQPNKDHSHGSIYIDKFEILPLGEWNAIKTFDGTNEFDYFGTSISLDNSGNRLLIGAPEGYTSYNRDDYYWQYDSSNSGYAVIYDISSGNIIDTNLSNLNSNPTSDSFYGLVTAINADGTIIAISDPKLYINNNSNRGNVYIYQLNGLTWSLIGDISSNTDQNKSGTSLALNGIGDIIAIGENRDGEVGVVKIYKYENFQWNKQIDLSDSYIFDGFGISISLNYTGNKIAISAPWHGESYDGKIYIYDYITQSDTWSETSTISGSLVHGDGYPGMSVSLNNSGDILAVGIDWPNGDLSNSTSTKIYKFEGSNWNLQGSNITSPRDSNYEGFPVAINDQGNILVIGTPLKDSTTNTNAGQVRIYQYYNNDWIQLGEDIIGSTSDEKLGFSISLNSRGDILAIASPKYNNNTGRVQVYQLSPYPLYLDP